jgi:hypothetical protein
MPTGGWQPYKSWSTYASPPGVRSSHPRSLAWRNRWLRIPMYGLTHRHTRNPSALVSGRKVSLLGGDPAANRRT